VSPGSNLHKSSGIEFRFFVQAAQGAVVAGETVVAVASAAAEQVGAAYETVRDVVVGEAEELANKADAKKTE